MRVDPALEEVTGMLGRQACIKLLTSVVVSGVREVIPAVPGLGRAQGRL